MSFKNVFSPLQVEALAFRASLVWAVDGDFQKTQVESDSLQIIEAVNDLLTNLSLIE